MIFCAMCYLPKVLSETGIFVTRVKQENLNTMNSIDVNEMSFKSQSILGN